jgi:DNA-directed RNA polymerase specialized sigma24 family protein
MAAPEIIRAIGSSAHNQAARYAGWLDRDDAELFREAERGNGAAFEQIASRYHHAVLALLLALTGSEQVALDLCHSTLLAAYREMQRRPQSLYIWFYRLAGHQWLVWAARGDSFSSGALAALTPRERLVFALKTHQRLALETIAQILDLPPEGVQRIFTRAVTKLRTIQQQP